MSTTHIEAMQVRISKKGMQGADIKVPGLLTDDQIADIPHAKVFEWIKVGCWRKRDFERWLRVLRVIEDRNNH